MSKFKLPKRFDATEAKEGVWFEITDEFEQSWGSFKCSLFDKTSASYRVAHQRWVRQNKKELDTGKLTGDQLAFKVFIDTSLHDWKGVLDGDDNEIPFSKETAYELFADEDAFFLADLVSQKAADVRNFQGSVAVEAKEDEKK